MDSRNEKRADAERVRPSASAAVMVIPEREVPGIRASAWAMPIQMTSVTVRLFSLRDCLPYRSAKPSNTPNPIVVRAMTSGDRR